MKALPGQPVCKHSVSMCFGRAPAPRAHSKLQQGRRGCAPAAAPAGPRWAEVGGYGRAPSRPSPAPQGQGWGQADGSFILSSILSGIWLQLMAFPGCSEVPRVGTLAERPEKCQRLNGWASLWRGGSMPCLLQSGPQAGQPHPRVYFGLSAGSFRGSSAGSSPRVADLSVTKEPGRYWLY